MFPMFGIPSSHHQQRQQRCRASSRHPFVSVRDLMAGACRGSDGCFTRTGPQFADAALIEGIMASPIFQFFEQFEKGDERTESKKMEADAQSKVDERTETGKNSDDKDNNDEDKEKDGAPIYSARDRLFTDVFRDVITSLGSSDCGKETPRWRQEVDCRGFKSRHIRVKIDARLLHIKAHKTEESAHGVSTSDLRKQVPLPENVDAKRITCKLSPAGILVIECPYMGMEGRKTNRHDFMKDLMETILPGLHTVVRNHFGSQASEHNTEDATQPKQKADNDGAADNVEVGPVADDKSVGEGDETGKAQNESSNEEETSKMSLAGQTQHSEDDQPSEDSTALVDHKVTSLQIQSDDYLQTPRADPDVDVSSETSEDSFVLLSELEKDDGSSKDVTDSQQQGEGEGQEVSQVCKADRTADTQAQDVTTKREECNSDSNTQEDATHQELEHIPCAQMEQPAVNGQATDHNHDSGKAQDFEYRIEMPSYNPATIKVNFDESERLLRISAVKESKISSGLTDRTDSITKSVRVPEHVDVDNLRCSFRDGTLSVTAPSHSPGTPPVRNIPVLV